MRAFRSAVAAALATVGVSTVAFGATIDFTTSDATITGPTNVQNNGVIVQAYDFNDAGNNSGDPGNLSINGVSFSSFPGASGDTTTMTDGNDNTGSNNSGFSGDFETLLSNQNYDNTNPSDTITLQGLTPNQQYQIELLTYDGRVLGGSRERQNSVTGDAGGGTAGTLTYLGNGTTVPAGTYVIGYFTANATSQAITFTAIPNNDGSSSDSDASEINGLVLSAVPEPASLAVLAVASLGILAKRRRAV